MSSWNATLSTMQKHYYNTHPQHDGATPHNAGTPDGNAFYRAIADLLGEAPDDWRAIRDTAFLFVFFVRSNTRHPLHAQYIAYEQSFRLRTGTDLFSALNSPDLVSDLTELCWVVGYALNIRLWVFGAINSFGRISNLENVGGPAFGTPCLMLRQLRPCRRSYLYSSLTADTSGKALVEHLQMLKAQNFGRLHMRQVSWAFMESLVHPRTISVSCFNEWRALSRIEHLLFRDPRHRLDTFRIVANYPNQLIPIVHLIKQSLELDPTQNCRVKVSPMCLPGVVKPYSAGDNEFVIVPREPVAGLSQSQATQLIHEGRAEYLCSVIQIGVGQHLTVDINILHMLQNATSDTVPALRYFFEEYLFNPGFVKLWWNPQRDAVVLFDTMCYMFQDTPRAPYKHTTYYGETFYITPQFHFTHPWLRGIRPAHLDFPRIAEEDQHCYLHSPGNDERGISCLCALGIVDIGACLDHVCRQQGLPAPKRPWYVCRPNMNYNEFLGLCLRYDRLAPLVHHLKGKKDFAFYQGLGEPGNECDDEALGYGTVDVLGIIRIFKQLITSDDRQFVAGFLADYCFFQRGQDPDFGTPRIVAQHPSPLGPSGVIPLFDDNPRQLSRRSFAQSTSKQLASIISTDGSLFQTESLRPWEHDHRVELSRELGDTKDARIRTRHEPYEGAASSTYHEVAGRQLNVLQHMTDPCRFWLPETMATALPAEVDIPVVRAGSTYTEELTRFLQSPAADNSTPPPGFGVPTWDPLGSPPFAVKVPGQDMKFGRNIFEAFVRKQGDNGYLLGPKLHVKNRQCTAPEERAKPQTLAVRKIKEKFAMFTDPVEAREAATAEVYQQVVQELTLNEQYGLPGAKDITDDFDFEGREYRRRIESAPDWNRRKMSYVPSTNKDGSWKSIATVTLRSLVEDGPEIDASWSFRKKQPEEKHDRSDSGVGL